MSNAKENEVGKDNKEERKRETERCDETQFFTDHLNKRGSPGRLSHDAWKHLLDVCVPVCVNVCANVCV